MALRDLTPAEAHALDELHAYKTDAFSCICPHCLEFVMIAGITAKPGVVRCPDCKELFAAWRRQIPETRSAKLPVMEAAETQ
ncbi:protein of unknown function [Hyphomicrobium sp. 1Nfss2.1]|uniref:hypothetical protein n=1 Tax=Hyphomicrobium sp. 1Nfss2.1 TaxID=3413936 RepID=UPI003C7ABFAF